MTPSDRPPTLGDDEDVEAEGIDAEMQQDLARAEAPAARRHNLFVRLYRGETSFDFIGRKKIWFGVSLVIILLGVASLATRGLNLGIDFKGGQSWLVTSKTLTVAQATTAAESAGVNDPTVVQLTNHLNGQRQIEVTADLNGKPLEQRHAIEAEVQQNLAKAAGTPLRNVNYSEVGPSWGSTVTDKAIEALIVFFIAVTIYISLRFEFKMAIAALVAVIHDVLVTVGIYSLTGFQVTPDTVVAVLTVLGYSLYDTVVVFDRIRDNSKGLGASGRITYSEMVNLSMNQTLARSINTSLVAIIPVLSVLVIGSFVLGATSLQDFGLALVIGLTSGAYSSIFIASPLLAIMKEREPRYAAIRQRLESRGDRVGALSPLAAATLGVSASAARSKGAAATNPGVIKPGSAKAAHKAQKAGGGAGGASGSSRPAGNRPPPRPRKGGGKGKRKRR